MPAEVAVAGVLFAALVLYVLTGGADFGGGVWDLLAVGPRRAEQRRVIARAIGPIWEANHVWLILVIVVMFVCFPKGFALVSNALHLPLTLMLFGVVIRGAAFVFRNYDSRDDVIQTRWSRVFNIASTVTPVLLGICVGTLASGRIQWVDGRYQGDFLEWLAPFPFAIGGFTLALFALLAAVYLLNATDDPDLREDFRLRALGATGALFGFAWLSYGLALSGAPSIAASLTRGPFEWLMQAMVAGLGATLVGALWTRRYGLARVLGVLQAVLLIAGWGAAQFPWIAIDALTLEQASAPDSILWGTVAILAVGAPFLGAAYAWMIWVFRQQAIDGAPGVH